MTVSQQLKKGPPVVRAGLVVLTFWLATTAGVRAVAADRLAYVVTQSSALSVVDLDTKSLSATVSLSVGTSPRALLFTRDGAFAYFANYADGTVSVLDTATNGVVNTILVGQSPQGLAITPDGRQIYVTNWSSGSVSVIDTRAQTVVATIMLPGQSFPYGVAVTPDGATAYVTGCGAPAGGVCAIDTATRTVTASLTASGDTTGVAITPDGAVAYVAGCGSPNDSICAIDTARNTIIATVRVGRHPEGVAITPDGARVYVTNTLSDEVSVIDTGTNTLVKKITGLQTEGIAMAPDGRLVYVTDAGYGNIAVIDTTNNVVTAAFSVVGFPDLGPLAIAVTPDGRRLYATLAGSSDVDVLDVRTGEKLSVIPGGRVAAAVAVTPKGDRAYAGTNPLSVIDTATNRVSATIPLSGGVAPGGIAVAPDGTAVYVASTPFAVVDAATNTVAATIPFPECVAGGPVVITPDGAAAYVASTQPQACNRQSGSTSALPPFPPTTPAVVVIDTLSRTLRTLISLPAVGSPAGIAVSPNGRFVYVTVLPPLRVESPPADTVQGSGTIFVIDTASNTFSSSIQVGGVLSGIAISPDGGSAYVADVQSSTIAILETATGMLRGTIAVSPEPTAITFSPDGSFALVADTSSNAISVIDTTANMVTATIDVGLYPTDIVILPAPKSATAAQTSSGGCTLQASAHDRLGAVLLAFPLALLFWRCTRRRGRRDCSCSLLGRMGFAASLILAASLHSAHARPIAYVASVTSGAVTELSTTRQEVAATVPLAVGFERLHARVSPDGTRLYIAGPDTISVIDTGSGMVIDTIQGLYCDTDLCSVGAIDVTPDGTALYATTLVSGPQPRRDALTVIDTSTDRPIASIPVGVCPTDIVIGSHGWAYVALESSQNIAVVDTVARTVVATIPLPRSPAVIALTPDDRFAYVGTWSDDASVVEVVDTRTNLLVAHVPVPRVPQGIAVTPDGRAVYIASTAGIVTVVDTATNEIAATIPARGAQRLVISPDGAFAYVSDYDSGHVLVIDTATKTVVAAIPVGPVPLALAVSPDGRRLYAVPPWGSPGASVIDTLARQVVTTIPDTYEFDSITLRPDGRFAYLATSLPRGLAVLVIDTARNRLVATIPLGDSSSVGSYGALRTAVSPDGRSLYASTAPITVIDTSSHAVTATISLPSAQAPVAIAFSPDGKRAYAVAPRDVVLEPGPWYPWALVAIDTSTRAVVSEQPLAINAVPVDIVVTPDGRGAYVSMEPPLQPQDAPPLPGAIAVVDLETTAIVKAFPYSSRRVVFEPDGHVAYAATDSAAVAIIDTAVPAITGWVDVGFAQRSIAIRPDGAFLYVAGFGSTVSVIDTQAAAVATNIFVGALVGDIVTGNAPDLLCPGDCDRDGQVTVDELIVCADIALGTRRPNACPSLSADGTMATVADVLRAVKAATNGCGART